MMPGNPIATLASMRLRWIAPMVRSVVAVVAIGLAVGASGASAAAPKQTIKKAIWGGYQYNGVSEFPIYRDLGVGLFETSLPWSTTAPTRPAHPRDPKDPAYVWPASLDYAIAQAAKYHMQVSLLVSFTPSWANGGRPENWAPTSVSDYADFLTAAAKRYPSVRHWMIWGEP